MTKSERYRYYTSREFGILKRRVRERSGGYCERCFIGPHDHTHHLTYERLGNERLEDLQALCEPCHQFVHGHSDHDPWEAHMQEERRRWEAEWRVFDEIPRPDGWWSNYRTVQLVCLAKWWGQDGDCADMPPIEGIPLRYLLDPRVFTDDVQRELIWQRDKPDYDLDEDCEFRTFLLDSEWKPIMNDTPLVELYHRVAVLAGVPHVQDPYSFASINEHIAMYCKEVHA